jgi:hypothetical protein
MKVNFLFALLAMLSLAACTPQYSFFTESLYQKQKWTEADISRIQFYISKDIVLTRALTEGETKISEGKIQIKNGRKVEQVIIRQGTPGVLVLMPKENRFAISFEESDDAYLMFGPNPKYDNRFALLAQDWEREKGKVHYKGNLYEVGSESAYASLMVDLRRIGDHEFQSRKAEGRLVKGQ